MSRQSLRSKKISSFYSFDYGNVKNVNADSRTIGNFTSSRINAQDGSVFQILDKTGPLPLPNGDNSSLSIGSNVGGAVSIGFDNSYLTQGTSTVSIGNKNSTNQGLYSVCMGYSNCVELGQLEETITIGSSNCISDYQSNYSVIIGTNNNGISLSSGIENVTCIGANNTIPGETHIGFNQTLDRNFRSGTFIGSDLNLNGHLDSDYLAIGNNMESGPLEAPLNRGTTTTALIGNNIRISELGKDDPEDIIAIGNNIGTARGLDKNCAVIGQNIGVLKPMNINSVIIGNDCEIPSFGIVSIGNFNGLTRVIGNDSVVIGNGINTSLTESLVINTLSTNYVTTDTLTKFILRAPIRRAAKNIGVNKLFYDTLEQELLYSST